MKTSHDIVKHLESKGYTNIRFRYERYSRNPVPKGLRMVDKLGITRGGFLVSSNLEPIRDIKKANKDFVKTGENQNFVEGIFKFRF